MADTGTISGTVVSLSLNAEHDFSKVVADQIELIAGKGVRGDAHCGVHVRHRSRVTDDPSQPNLRQVHLIGEELLLELSGKGYEIPPGALGENVLTKGIDLLALPQDAVLTLGKRAQVQITGLRNPCGQIEQYRSGLLKEVVSKTDDGMLERRAGIMGVVLKAGTVLTGDAITVTLPSGPHLPLERI